MKHVFQKVLHYSELQNESSRFLLWLEHNQYDTDSYKWLTNNIQLRTLLYHTSDEEELLNILKNINTYIQFQKVIRSKDEFHNFLKFSNVVLLKSPIG